MADETHSYGVGGRSGRFRTFIIFITALVIVVGAMGYLYYSRHHQVGVESKAVLTGPPSIGSVPGEATTPEYARTVEQENIRQAEEAAKTGGSSVATIVRPSFAGAGEFESTDTAAPGCSMEELKRAREAGVKASELKCRGCTAKQLRAAGYSAAELVAAGYGAAELKAAGFTAAELRAAGMSAAELRKAGYSPYELAQAGYSVCDVARTGVKPQDLEAAGFKPEQLAAAGLGAKFTREIPKTCDPQALMGARKAGIMAAELRKLTCGAGALRAAGYTAKELRDACYTVAELKAAGFTPAELRAAGFGAAELRAAGFSAKELKEAGFSAAELRAAGYSVEQLKAAGFTADELRKAGYTQGDLKRAGFSDKELGGAGALANAAQLKAAGYSAKDLKAQGYTAAQLLAAGFTPDELRAAGFSDDEIANATSGNAVGAAGPMNDADAAALMAAKAALQNPCSELSLQNAKKQGKTYADLKGLHCTAAQYRNAGIPVSALEALLADELARERQLTPDQRRDLISNSIQVMETMSNNMFSSWAPPDKQQYVAAPEPKAVKGDGKEGDNAAGQGGAAGGAVGPDGKPIKKLAGPVIKAGTVMYGVIDSSINSDEKSPVLASIVSGDFKGAKLIGEFTVQNDVVVVKFTKINIPAVTTSLPFEAYAIDPDTARTALAHDVDNHYMLRYGTLFASSFLSGLASAISSSGSQTSSGAGGIVTTHDPLNTSQQIFVALGNVGTQFASQMGAVFTKPPTVTVDAGASIGVLFTTDLVVPEMITAGKF